jgi:hypothetical protein
LSSISRATGDRLQVVEAGRLGSFIAGASQGWNASGM